VFSIVMPLWNKREMVTAALEGALAQSFGDFELVVVDDGSTDGSRDAVEALKDKRIRVIVQANGGPGAARNAGMLAAHHDWISFLDADDLWLPDHLAELDRLRGRFPAAGLIGTSYITCGSDGRFRLPPQSPGRLEAINYFERVASGRRVLWTSSAAIPRSNLATVGNFGTGVVGEDTLYWLRIALALPVAVSTRVTVAYRLNTGGVSDRTAERWRGRDLREPSDISPRLALLLERYAEIESAEVRRGVDRFIDHDFRWCLRSSARSGDLDTVRALPGLLPRCPGLADRLLLRVGLMPAPLARLLYAIGFRIYPPLRRLGERLKG